MFHLQIQIMKQLLFIFSTLTGLTTFAQDVNFNQVNLTNLYSNPALTGVNGEQKITAVYRSQWPSLSNSVRSSYVSYQDGSQTFGNLGAYYMNSYYSNGAFNSNRLGLNYAKPIQLAPNFTITPGISGSFILDHINFSKITFGDLANPRTGELYDPLELKENTFSADFSGGLLVNWKGVFAGVSFNQFGNIGSHSIFNTYANIGVTLITKRAGIVLIPELSLNTTQGFYSTAIKLSSYYKWAKLGLEYNLRNGFSAVAGASIGQFDVFLSSEWCVTQASNFSSPSFSGGLSYVFKKGDGVDKKPIYQYSLF